MADPSIPNVFVNGQASNATTMNENFDAIITAISSASTADLGCGTLKVATIAFASAVVSAMQSASVNQLTVVNTFNVGHVAASSVAFGALAISGNVGMNLNSGTVYFGADATDGTWRLGRKPNNDDGVWFEKYSATTWVIKASIAEEGSVRVPVDGAIELNAPAPGVSWDGAWRILVKSSTCSVLNLLFQQYNTTDWFTIASFTGAI